MLGKLLAPNTGGFIRFRIDFYIYMCVYIYIYLYKKHHNIGIVGTSIPTHSDLYSPPRSFRAESPTKQTQIP